MINHPQPKENGLAVASLVLGITSLAGFGALTGIPAIITGVMGMKNPYNKNMAVAGMVMGIISTAVTLLAIVAILLIVFVFAAAAANTDPASLKLPDQNFDYSFQRET